MALGDRAAVVTVDLVSSAPVPLLAVAAPPPSLPDVLPPAAQLLEARGVLVAFVEKFPHLGQKDGVSQVEAAVLVIECEILVLLLPSIRHGLTYIIGVQGRPSWCYLAALPQSWS